MSGLPEPQSLDIATKLLLGLWVGLCSGALLLALRMWLKAEGKLIAAATKELATAVRGLSKKQGELNGSIVAIAEREAKCRENLPRDYASKQETKEDFKKLFTEFEGLLRLSQERR